MYEVEFSFLNGNLMVPRGLRLISIVQPRCAPQMVLVNLT
jgi:hypothetical protein